VLDMIAFDADDTLWHNEVLYTEVQERFRQLLAPYADPKRIDECLYQTEIRNLTCYGYGIKAFALSLIEAAIELSDGRISGLEVGKVLAWAKGMVRAEVRLLPQAATVVAQLAARFPLMLITKGDLLDQEAKLARSGLAAYFPHVEVVSDKTPDRYAALLARHGLEGPRFMMVGNSLRSDILPVVALRGQAVYIPYQTTWAHEEVAVAEEERGRFHQLEHLGQLPGLVAELCGQAP
jgi:putative hydrolase of the HAD superfamily